MLKLFGDRQIFKNCHFIKLFNQLHILKNQQQGMLSQESGGSCESVESVDSNGEVQMGFRRCGGSYKFKKRLEQFVKFKVLDLGVVLKYILL